MEFADEHRLVEQLGDLQPRRRRGARHVQGLLDRVDDAERRGVAVLDDAEQHRAAALGAHHVLLHQGTVADVAYVLEEDGGAARELHGDAVEIVEDERHRIGADGILGVADLRGAGRQGQVLGVDGIDHVQRGQSLRLQLGRIEIDHDLPVAAAGRRRKRHAMDRGQALAQPVDAVIVELLLVEVIRAQADLQDRYARCIVLHHDRRLDARRHDAADRVGAGYDLCDREVEIDVGLEEDLLNRNPVQGLRLDVLDAVDAGADREFAIGRDPLFHLRGAQPGIGPDHRHHRDVDLGKDVGRHRDHGGEAEERNQQCQDIESMRKPQCEAYNSHQAFPSTALQAANDDTSMFGCSSLIEPK